jgi:hypothetical protein
MRFYRVAFGNEEGNSGGYAWFTTIAEARRFARGKEPDDATSCVIDPTPEPVDIEPTKRGILDALNRYADHPNNG